MSGERPTQQNSPDTEFGLSVNSRARKVSAIRAFFRYLTDKKHLLETNPMASLESPTIRKTLPVYLTADDSVNFLIPQCHLHFFYNIDDSAMGAAVE